MLVKYERKVLKESQFTNHDRSPFSKEVVCQFSSFGGQLRALTTE